jgi:hypothetical protein
VIVGLGGKISKRKKDGIDGGIVILRTTVMSI